MAVVYARSAHVTVTGPEVFVPGWFPTAAAPKLLVVSQQASGEFQAQAAEAFPWEPMAGTFTSLSEVGPGVSVLAGVASEDPILPFVNYDVRAHWPPYGPGSRFANWAARVGVNPYFAARSYASHDHPGSHAMEKIQAEIGRQFEDALTEAITDVLSG